MKTPEENIIDTLKGKSILFLENDRCLSNQIRELSKVLNANKIKHTILFELQKKPIETIKKQINKSDVIVFQTQWVYDISKKLFEYVKNLEQKKIIIEAYIADPTWYYKGQHGSKHDVYIYNIDCFNGESTKETETFYELTEEPYWDYKNNFNK